MFIIMVDMSVDMAGSVTVVLACCGISRGILSVGGTITRIFLAMGGCASVRR